jgi:hypothetical protein
MKTRGIFIHKRKQCGPNISLANDNILSSDLGCFQNGVTEENVIFPPLSEKPRESI